MSELETKILKAIYRYAVAHHGDKPAVIVLNPDRMDDLKLRARPSGPFQFQPMKDAPPTFNGIPCTEDPEVAEFEWRDA